MKKICLILGSGATCGSGYKHEINNNEGFSCEDGNLPTDQKFFKNIELQQDQYPALSIITKNFNTKSMETTMVLIEAGFLLLSGKGHELDYEFDEWLVRTLNIERDTFHKIIIDENTKYQKYWQNKRAGLNKDVEEIPQFLLTGDAQREMWYLIWRVYGRLQPPKESCANNFKKIFSIFEKDKNSFDVITFNYDLLAEQNLNRYTYINSEGVQVHVDDTPVVAKLHGSLNWQEQCRARKQFDVLQGQNAIPVIDYKGKAGGDYIQPGIVAPTFTKAEISDKGNNPIRKMIRAQWDYAESLLDRADHWIFFGYSFPRTDQHAKDTFNKVKNKNQKRKLVIDIDKSLSFKQNFEKIIGENIEFSTEGFKKEVVEKWLKAQ